MSLPIQLRRATLFLVLVLSACMLCSDDANGQTNTQPLKDLAADRGTRIGSYYQYDYRDADYDAVFEQEYDLVTVGMFWEGGVEHSSRLSYDFTTSDESVDFGTQRGMRVHGHVLVWFDDIPAWVKSLRPALVQRVMNEHIDTVVGRYRGRVWLWDVVNEAFEEDGQLRRNHKWYQAMGPAYIRKAFVRARRADRDAILRLNEYNLEIGEAKFRGVRNFLRRLKNQRVPVDALGWQMHLNLVDRVDYDILLARFNEIADLGIDNYITELDVELSENPTPEDYEQQKQIYKSVISTFLKARRHKTIVIWGLRDGDPNWLTDLHPLPFDESYQRKPAYDGIQEALTESDDSDED